MIKHPIELLRLSKAKESQFVNKGLTTIEDVAYFFPRRYIDFRHVSEARNAVVGTNCTLCGIVLSIRENDSRFSAVVEEEKESLPGYKAQFTVTWFGTNYYIKQLEIGEKYFFCGKITEFMGNLQMTSPIAFGKNQDSICRILPIYSKIQGMSNDYLLKQIAAALQYLRAGGGEGEKDLFAKSLGLIPKYDAAEEIHRPTAGNKFKQASERMAFEEIYDFYEDLKRKDLYLTGTSLQSMHLEKQTRKTIDSLPFPLTADQMNTINLIIHEAKQGRRIHSMISGDVGCGKTMMAILSSIFMWENGYQTILMAPTLVLAQQHYQEFEACCQPLGIKIGLLSTQTKKKERTALLAAFKAGSLSILIGTHAVLSDDIVPANLGMTIIDEEHKFGVSQKAKLEEFDKAGVHHLSMTATPIPRSIAMTIYGDELAVLPIRTMPKGRKPILTTQCSNPEEAFEKIYEEINKGQQGYIICPFIEDSESPKFQNVVSVAAAKKMAEDYFRTKPNPVSMGVISGDMSQKSILATVAQFEAKQFDVLISTTIVEVGVNIPNATVIAIMSAGRFGMAALHQLRGRVGRGTAQSYCLLCSPDRSERLDIMCKTSDGFTIAEQDLRLRGPGDLTGDAQSGDSKVIELIMKRPNLSAAIRQKFFAPKVCDLQ